MGVRVKITENQSQTSIGEYGWGGMAGNYFLIDPKNQTIAILMTQFLPANKTTLVRDFVDFTYKALADS